MIHIFDAISFFSSTFQILPFRCFNIIVLLHLKVPPCQSFILFLIKKKREKFPSLKGSARAFHSVEVTVSRYSGRLKRGVRWHFLRLLVASRGPAAQSFRWRFTVSTTRSRQCTVSVYVYYNSFHLHDPICPDPNYPPRPPTLHALQASQNTAKHQPLKY